MSCDSLFLLKDENLLCTYNLIIHEKKMSKQIEKEGSVVWCSV